MKQETAGCKMANLGQLGSVRLKRSTAERHAGGKVPIRGNSCRVQRDEGTDEEDPHTVRKSKTSETQYKTSSSEFTECVLFSIT